MADKLRELWQFHKPVVIAATSLIVMVALALGAFFALHHSYSTPTYQSAPASVQHADPPVVRSLNFYCQSGAVTSWSATNNTGSTIVLYNISGGYSNGNTFLKAVPGGIVVPPGATVAGQWAPLFVNQYQGHCGVQGYNISPLPATWTLTPNMTSAQITGG